MGKALDKLMAAKKFNEQANKALAPDKHLLEAIRKSKGLEAPAQAAAKVADTETKVETD